jgi:hypothetical protein
MIVPIRDGNGQVIGSLIGLTNLAASNFLDEIGANRFGRQGGYLITDPAQRIFIAATDKTRVMQPGPPVGVNRFDRYIDGHEGSGWRAVRAAWWSFRPAARCDPRAG